ncbi:MAG: DUF2062 domain-containing protein [Cyanobacteria bacterium P01_F01_bin.33]
MVPASSLLPSRRLAFGMKPLRSLRYLYLRLIRLQASPAEIGRGLAIGVFAAMFPAFGLQTIISILIATAVRGNKLAAAAATWVSNPLTYVPIYAFNFHVGQQILGARSLHFDFAVSPSLNDLTQMGADFLVVMFVGSFVVGTVSAGLSYAAAVPIVRRIKQRLHKQRSL